MDKKNIIGLIVAVVLIIVAFYGGTKYAQSQQAAARSNFGNFAGRNLSGQPGQNGRQFGGLPGQGGASGEILSLDNNSLTIKLPNGGSRLVLLSASTTVSKNVPGNQSDLVQGQSVIVIGSANQDGSVTAQSIQLRSANGNVR